MPGQVLIERCGPPAVKMPTKHGLFTAHCFRSLVDGVEHIALVKAPDGAPDETPFALSSRPALVRPPAPVDQARRSRGRRRASSCWPRRPQVRVHSECCTGDIFGSLRCDCGPQVARCAHAPPPPNPSPAPPALPPPPRQRV